MVIKNVNHHKTCIILFVHKYKMFWKLNLKSQDVLYLGTEVAIMCNENCYHKYYVGNGHS